MLGQEPVPELRVLIRLLCRPRGGENDPALSTKHIELCVDGADVARYSVSSENLCAHSAGKTAVKNEKEPAGWDATEEFYKMVEREGRT